MNSNSNNMSMVASGLSDQSNMSTLTHNSSTFSIDLLICEHLFNGILAESQNHEQLKFFQDLMMRLLKDSATLFRDLVKE